MTQTDRLKKNLRCHPIIQDCMYFRMVVLDYPDILAAFEIGLQALIGERRNPILS